MPLSVGGIGKLQLRRERAKTPKTKTKKKAARALFACAFGF
jgi:hypothetical protein